MDKIMLNGEQWIRLHDMCDILRNVADDAIFENTDKVMNQIAHLMFYDEVQEAETDEEREAALEFPGDFIVVRRTGKKSFDVFEEWKDKQAVIGHDMKRALSFEYKSMADLIAEKLGEGWQSVCMGIEDGRIIRRTLERLNAFIDAASDIEEEEQK